jgi:hypothetical protein
MYLYAYIPSYFWVVSQPVMLCGVSCVFSVEHFQETFRDHGHSVDHAQHSLVRALRLVCCGCRRAIGTLYTSCVLDSVVVLF